MFALLIVGVAIVYAAEAHGSVAQHAAGIAGGNLEGKETRFGVTNSALWSAITTVTSCGAVNAALDSLTGIGGAIPMSNMMVGEVVFGGVGSGLYGMLLFVLLAVFIAGLMVGRTPEYLGKKIEAREVKLVMIGTLAMPLLVLFTVALATATKYGAPSLFNAGPQGFSEHLYAYTSQANNNGSAFAGYTGLRAAERARQRRRVRDHVRRHPRRPGDVRRALPAPCSPRWRSPARSSDKRVAPLGPGTMRTDTPIFVVLLIGVILLVALLTFVPALLLGPVVQGLTHPALLRPMRKDLISSARRRRRAHRDLRPRLSARHHRRQPGRLPRPRRRQPDQEGRQGRRLAADRPGLQRRPLAVPDPPVADRLQPGRRPRSRTSGPNSKDLRDNIAKYAPHVPAPQRAVQPAASRAAEIPPDAVQTSASGVDPQISVANARIQAGRVAARTGIPKARVLALVKDNTDDRALGLFGEPGVNVLDLNLAIQEARR